MAKKRAPIEQLREAGKVATEMLRQRGILSKVSSIDAILADPRSPTLPGIPAYLPHAWTLKSAQRQMHDLVIIWKGKFEHNPSSSDKDDFEKFWNFVLAEYQDIVRQYNKEIVGIPKLVRQVEDKVGTVPLLKDVFSPLQKKDNAYAMAKFMVDSFAVAVKEKQHHSVAEFLNWYLDWTDAMHELWIKPQNRKPL